MKKIVSLLPAILMIATCACAADVETYDAVPREMVLSMGLK